MEDEAEAKAEETRMDGWHEYEKKNHVHVDLEAYTEALPAHWLTLAQKKAQKKQKAQESDSESDSDSDWKWN